MLKDLFEKAEQQGITRGAIGVRVFGRKAYNRIYQLNNPTFKTIEKIQTAIKELIEEKNKKNEK